MDVIDRINEALNSGVIAYIQYELRCAAEEFGWVALEYKTSLTKEQIRLALSPRSKPKFDHILKIIKAFGFDVQVKLSETKKCGNP